MKEAAKRKRDKLERRSRIMDAAERVFLHTPVMHTTMEQIAQAAEVSKGTLYLYFETKEALYLSIAQRAVDELVRREERVRQEWAGSTGYAWFEAALRCYIDYALEFRDRFRVAMSWLYEETPPAVDPRVFADYQRGVAEAFQFGCDALEQGKRDGSVKADIDAALSLFQVWGGIVGLLLMLANPAEVTRRLPFQVDFEEALESHLLVQLKSIRAPSNPALEQSGLRFVGKVPGAKKV